MVTGRDDIEAVDEAYRAGATDFIAKPINWPMSQKLDWPGKIVRELPTS